MGRSLYVGVDESNHAGDDRVKGEIIVATFSYCYEDSLVKRFANRRDYEATEKWLKKGNRDYKFTLLTDERWRTSSRNLIEVSPLLINAFLKDNSNLQLEALKIYLDGNQGTRGKIFLRDQFKPIRTIVQNFTKKGRNRKGRMYKRPVCPEVVYRADILSNSILSLDLETCLRHPKFVPYRR